MKGKKGKKHEETDEEDEEEAAKPSAKAKASRKYLFYLPHDLISGCSKC